jgi:poly(3-hydroxybutyrate) depolymerase
MALFAGLTAKAQTINLRGTVTNSGGQGISGVLVTLVGQNLKDTTDAKGAYAIKQSSSAISPGLVLHDENIVLNRGVLELNLAAPTSVKIEIFDIASNLLKEKTFPEAPAGEFRWNINEDFGAANLLIVRATIGGRVSTFQYFPLSGGRYSVKSAERSSPGKALAKTTAAAAVGSLEFKADGYGTKVVEIASYTDSLNVSLTQGTADRWGGLKNAPIKSAGCGKALGTISKSGTYTISSSGGRGTYIIDIPTGYDKDTPYRLIFGNHCMGGSAARVAEAEKGSAGDDLSGFYSIKTMATKDNIPAIYVAMQGNSDGTWTLPNDSKFWNDVLTLVETNLCVDTTRVFVTGFSFGAMFSYVLSLEYPEKIRAVATYAPANYNMTQPTNRHIPIAYYQTTGISDDRCPWVNNESGKTGGKFCLLQHMQDNGCTSTAADIKITTSSTHVSTEFTGCKEGYPVKFGSFQGGHQAVHTDPGTNFSWIEKEAWEFFKRF